MDPAVTPSPPPTLFKYATAETTRLVLSSGQVRYSSPLLFNDPFDVQSGLHFEFQLDALPARVLDRLEEFVMQEDAPSLPDDNPWARAIALMREKRGTHGFPREHLKEKASHLLAGLAESVATYRQQYQDLWWKDFLPRLRVFSVSEKKDNLLMWAHYARDHTGAVLELAVLPDEDNALSTALPIEYCKAPPSLFTLSEYFDYLFGVRIPDRNALYYRYARVKSDIWSYEREWRVWFPSDATNGALFEDVALRRNEVVAVYLGCRMAEDTRHEIESLTRKRYPQASVYGARKSEAAFALEYDAI